MYLMLFISEPFADQISLNGYLSKQHHAAFHQCLRYLLRQNCSSENYNLPSKYSMNYPDLTVCSFLENPISIKRVNQDTKTYTMSCQQLNLNRVNLNGIYV